MAWNQSPLYLRVDSEASPLIVFTHTRKHSTKISFNCTTHEILFWKYSTFRMHVWRITLYMCVLFFYVYPPLWLLQEAGVSCDDPWPHVWSDGGPPTLHLLHKDLHGRWWFVAVLPRHWLPGHLWTLSNHCTNLHVYLCIFRLHVLICTWIYTCTSVLVAISLPCHVYVLACAMDYYIKVQWGCCRRGSIFSSSEWLNRRYEGPWSRWWVIYVPVHVHVHVWCVCTDVK